MIGFLDLLNQLWMLVLVPSAGSSSRKRLRWPLRGALGAHLRYVRKQARNAGVELIRQWVPADESRVFASSDNGIHMVGVELGLPHLIG